MPRLLNVVFWLRALLPVSLRDEAAALLGSKFAGAFVLSSRLYILRHPHRAAISWTSSRAV